MTDSKAKEKDSTKERLRSRAKEIIMIESEAKYRTIFETTGTASIIIEEDTTISLVNKEFEKLSGFSKEEIEGKKSWTEFIMREDLEWMKEYHRLRRAVQGSAPKTYETRFVDRSGNIKNVLLTVDMIPGTQMSVGSCLDITKLKRTEEELKKALEKLKKILGGVIQVVASIAEARDPYTADHQKRVTDLACSIAAEMSLAKDRIEGIYMAGMIHDIGKISVPAEILTKPNKLTALEFDLIKSHPKVGYDILKTVDFPWPIAKIVFQHHERLDGSGYPSGLSREDILLESRILSVADVVEAMASHRPYRPAIGIEKALEEISQKSGDFYDSDVVGSCVKLFKEKSYQFGKGFFLSDS